MIRAVPDAVIGRLNLAFEAMARDGSSRRIERNYETWGQPIVKP